MRELGPHPKPEEKGFLRPPSSADPYPIESPVLAGKAARRWEANMKISKRLLLLSGLLAISLGAVFMMAAATQETQLKANSNVTQKLAPLPLPCNGPDLTATQMSVKAENYNGQWWVVTRAQISNKGGLDYSGKTGQAVVQLTCKKSWDPTHPTTMDSYYINHLAKGSFQPVQGSFQLPNYVRPGWDSPLGRNECHQEVQIILKIVFDPDIRSDGNPANDDCNAGNNTWPDTPDTHIKFTAVCLKAK